MRTFISIALGGSLGALSRYYLSKFISSYSGGTFPWGTLIINLSGSLLIGFFYGVFDRTIVPDAFKTFISIGFIGAFTTFSTFAIENVNLFRDGEIKLGLLNIFISNIFGIFFALCGIYISKIIIHK